MPNPIHLIPAYGRDYPSSEAVLSAWRRGLDFRISDISSEWNGKYCSCRDFARNETVLIRYHRLTLYVITNGLRHPNFQQPSFHHPTANPDKVDEVVKSMAEQNRRNYSRDIRAIKSIQDDDPQ